MKTALIIDDSRLARLTLKRLIVKHDIEVYEAEGVAQAQAWLAHNIVPDVIFLDIMMPNVDGFEGLAMFKQDAKTKNIPIIMYSGDVSEASRAKARDGGASGYLPKPADTNRVDHLITALSKREKTSTSPTSSTKSKQELVKEQNTVQNTSNIQPSASEESLTTKMLERQIQHLTYRLAQLEKQQTVAKQSQDTYSAEEKRDLTFLQRQSTNAQHKIKLALIMGFVALILAVIANISILLF